MADLYRCRWQIEVFFKQIKQSLQLCDFLGNSANAREGAATTIQHLARFDDERRYGSLVAVLLETMATLTDEILDLHDRFIGSLFNKAKRKHDEAFQASGKAITPIGPSLLFLHVQQGGTVSCPKRVFAALLWAR